LTISTHFEKSLKRFGEIIKRANEDRLRYEAEQEKVRIETEKIEKQERETLMITPIEYVQLFALIAFAGFISYTVHEVANAIDSILHDYE
jgi:hypothetical protein